MKKMIMLLLLAPGILAADKLYKWLDSKGVIHYSVDPPDTVRPGDIQIDAGDIISFEPKAIPYTTAVSSVANNDSNNAKNSAYCQKVRSNLITLYKNQRVRLRLSDGTYHELDETEKKEKITEISGLLKKHCH